MFVPPQKTAISPKAARKETGKPIRGDKVLPRVEPMKKRGITSPPRNPLPMVTAVNTILAKKARGGTGSRKAALTIGSPRPK